jgi:ABC-type sugar transport system ATPase subunit
MPSGAATLGIRPDQLRVEPGAATCDAVPAVIRAVERLGDRTDVVLAVGSTRLTARVENDEHLAEGGPAGVRIALEAAHLFAPGEDGVRLPDALDGR